MIGLLVIFLQVLVSISILNARLKFCKLFVMLFVASLTVNCFAEI